MRHALPTALCALAAAACGLPANAVEMVGRMEHEALAEVSGIVKSARSDFYWVHNDSGDSARLFAIAANGTPIRPSWLGVSIADWQGHAVANAVNFDWEDIALADGVLYIADVGNNGNARRDLGVYVVNEPDPLAVQQMRALTYWPLRYPDQQEHPGDVWHFDCEALFVADGKLYFLTKHRQPRQFRSQQTGTKLYRLDTFHTDRENTLTPVGQRDDVLSATAADLSPSGNRLAVATYTALWLFERPASGDNWLAGKAWKSELEESLWRRQLEAIAWQDEDTLLLANERRDLMTARTTDFSPVP